MANKEEQIGAGQVIHAETFRDSVATIEQTGSRKWVYPKKTKREIYQLQRYCHVHFISHFLYYSIS